MLAMPTSTRMPPVGIAVVMAFLVSSLLASCASSPSESSLESDPISTATTIDPGPGPTTFEANIRLDPVVTGLADPVAVVARPMRNQFWIAERAGRVRVVTRNTEWDLATARVKRSEYRLEPAPVLDLSQLTTTEGTGGLLSLAFSTDGQTLYVHHSGRNGELIAARYTVTDPLDFSGAPRSPEPGPGSAPDPAIGTSTSTSTTAPNRSATPPTTTPGPIGRPAIDPATRVELLTVEHERTTQHRGSHLALGPDGFLYISTIGTGGGIVPDAAQDPNSRHGKILRIDPSVPDGDLPYSIPSDNPFAEGGGAPEVWTLGIRATRGYSFDRSNGDLWIGDVGRDDLEEIDLITHGRRAGVNLGWPVRQGDQPSQQAIDGGITASSELTEPALTYPHTEGRCAVIGGYVYRGSAIAGLQGVYLYADHCTGELRGLLSRRGVVLTDKRLNASIEPSTLNGFGQDDQGELYILTTAGTLSIIMSAP
jgi:hypothetical protein